MLRSTSVKLDSWKPVKLLARQSVSNKIIGISCDLKGDIVAALTGSSIDVFANRELLESIPLKKGKQIYVSENSNSILALTSTNLICYDSWGQIKWEYDKVNENSILSTMPNFDFIAVSNDNSLSIIGRFGEVIQESIFDGKIVNFSFTPDKKIVISTDSGLFILELDGKLFDLKSDTVYSDVYCTENYFITVSGDTMYAFSYGGLELWRREGKIITNVSFSNDGIKHIFTSDSKSLVCQDRNGEEIWTYRSKENLLGAFSLESGKMAGVFSNSVFHIIDHKGKQAWSHQGKNHRVFFS